MKIESSWSGLTYLDIKNKKDRETEKSRCERAVIFGFIDAMLKEREHFIIESHFKSKHGDMLRLEMNAVVIVMPIFDEIRKILESELSPDKLKEVFDLLDSTCTYKP